MKRHLTHILLTAGLAAFLGSAALNAQDRIQIADIPFAFHASDQTLPAGTYTVWEKSLGLFVVSDKDGHSLFVSAPLLEGREPANPSLTFRCYGNERVPAKIWMADGNGYDIGKSSVDRKSVV